jgi:hypothetical protein
MLNICGDVMKKMKLLINAKIIGANVFSKMFYFSTLTYLVLMIPLVLIVNFVFSYRFDFVGIFRDHSNWCYTDSLSGAYKTAIIIHKVSSIIWTILTIIHVSTIFYKRLHTQEEIGVLTDRTRGIFEDNDKIHRWSGIILIVNGAVHSTSGMIMLLENTSRFKTVTNIFFGILLVALVICSILLMRDRIYGQPNIIFGHLVPHYLLGMIYITLPGAFIYEFFIYSIAILTQTHTNCDNDINTVEGHMWIASLTTCSFLAVLGTSLLYIDLGICCKRSK